VGIIHGDIKGCNILVGGSEEAKICDFGLAKLPEALTLTTLKGAGTSRWRAPEMFENMPRSFETDVYAYGITIAEVCSNMIKIWPYTKYML
jgi:serine/threonine protein kinase